MDAVPADPVVLGDLAEQLRALIGEVDAGRVAAAPTMRARIEGAVVALVARIVVEHRDGASWSAIARDLNADDVPTAHGGVQWYPASVRKVALGQDAGKLIRA